MNDYCAIYHKPNYYCINHAMLIFFFHILIQVILFILYYIELFL